MTLPTPCGHPAPCGLPCELNLGPERHAVLDLGDIARLAVLAVPGRRGPFRQQADDLFAQLRCLISRQTVPVTATTMMVFLRHAADELACREIIARHFGPCPPLVTFVVQPPCCGAELGVELWALGGPGVVVHRPSPHILTIESDGLRWIHLGGVRGPAGDDAYGESLAAFEQLREQLARVGARFDQVVRTWIYVNRITEGPEGRRRYQEMNRARTDFYRDIRFGARLRAPWSPEVIYPASTGIGSSASGITLSALALASTRPDVFILPLENPQQTPAYAYHARYSLLSPKFSRAMAVVQGHFVTTLVSGTASVLRAGTCHAGDVARQTHQAIENIEHLLAPENFTRHGLPGTGARLEDIAKLRVYVRNLDEYEICREICEERFPRVPAIYLQADLCRPDLLVEIEAVAFSPYRRAALRPFRAIPPPAST